MKETKSGLVVPEHMDISGGKIRRPGDGGRTAADFFAAENHGRSLTRGELINVVGMIEYGRRENVWWRKLYRRLRGWPMAQDLATKAAVAHGKSLHAIRQKMEAAALEEQRALAEAHHAKNNAGVN